MAETKNLAKVRLRGELRRREPMARHVSWRAGGSVEQAYLPADLDDLAAFLRTLPEAEPIHFVGLGSNLLVRDGGLRGTVVLTHRSLRAVRIERRDTDGGMLYAEAGAASPKVARHSATHDLAGAEFLAGVPGTLGGALAMNAGCFGAETWDVIAEVTTIDRRGGLHTHTRDDYDVGYRHVQLKEEAGRRKAEEWFVAARLSLMPGDRKELMNKIKSLLTKRLATQPLDEHNAGSVFRNPQGDYAARLIEACGLKGRAIGGAQISAKHANFIVNPGDARAADIEALIELAEKSVKEKFGVKLDREVRIVGEA
ncbi:MAG TPA: UDP-N-acetylmuramate dehydrogenase [Burkholderiales bacterium]|nr:UDP-N-acetylmuramate dehydrogenase [Burkholderiales bacterium]